MSVLDKIRELVIMMQTATTYSFATTFETDQGLIMVDIQRVKDNLTVKIKGETWDWADVSSYFQLAK